MQIGFLKLKIPMTDAVILSAHGRDGEISEEEASRSLGLGKNLGIYTDEINTPQRIYESLNGKGLLEGYNFHVLTDLCSKNEKLYKNPSPDMQGDLSLRKNIVILENRHPSHVKAAPPRAVRAQEERPGAERPRAERPHAPGTGGAPAIGIEDESFIHAAGEPTKKEVRSVALSLMGISHDSVIIDAGCGSGSVTIEAAGIAKEGTVYAVDKNRVKIENLKKNMNKFNRSNIIPVLGELPEALKSCGDSPPDVVFIGGGGAALKETLSSALSMLREGGRIVVNTILLESFNTLMSFIEGYNARNNPDTLKFEVVSVIVSRLKDIKPNSYFQAQNQVLITKIEKHKRHEHRPFIKIFRRKKKSGARITLPAGVVNETKNP